MNTASLNEVILTPVGDSAEMRDVVSGTAATLAVAEVGLGSLLHGLHVPLGGHFLSLNQGFFMSRATHKLRRSRGAFKAPFYIAQISALLKSLAPAGNKLGPMLSIGMQGFLFTLPVAVLGPNLVGILLGMALMSLWAFAQPLAVLYLFFGHDLVAALQMFVKKSAAGLGVAPSAVWNVLAALIVIKALAAAITGWIATRVSDERVARLQKIAARRSRSVSKWILPRDHRPISIGQRVGLAVRDMCRPFFLGSFAIMGLFFYFAEGGAQQVLALLLRPLAVAFLFFLAARSGIFSRWGDRLRLHPRFATLMSYYDHTLRKLAAG